MKFVRSEGQGTIRDMSTKVLVPLLLLILLSLSGKAQNSGVFKIQDGAAMMHTENDTLSFLVFIAEEVDTGDLFFMCNLQADVCSDQVCLPIEVDLYWDLLGNYSHFVKPPGVEFTKFDHDVFLDEDYEKLQSILIDSLSVLRDYDVEDLLDSQNDKYSFEIDAVTRPTSPLFSGVTVPGALYTVYTLWHIVQGEVKAKMLTYLKDHYHTKDWEARFAVSNRPAYQEFFLNHLSEGGLKKYEQNILALLQKEDPYVAHSAIKVLGSDFWSNPDKYLLVLDSLDRMKPHVVTALLEQLNSANGQVRAVLESYGKTAGATSKHKELINKILEDEK